MSILEREIDARSDLPEIISWAFDDAEGNIVGPSDIWSDSRLQSGAKLANGRCVAVAVDGMSK